MSETERVRIDTSEASEGLAALSEEMDRFVTGELNPLAEAVEETFGRMGRTVTRELSGAARTGRLSMKALVDDVLSDLARLAADGLVRRPVEEALNGLFAGAFGGARAGGGAVARGQAFLGGERGPEVFVPSAPGRIAPQGGVTVNVTVAGGPSAPDFKRSQAQVAAGVARALRKAGRHV
jgi:phage-related minor tail protein